MRLLFWLIAFAMACLVAYAAMSLVWPVPAKAESAVASWYGGKHHGRRTANGERFNMHALTAAHRSLPFGTRLHVCARACGSVRINDRGPFVRGRSLDLSAAAARAIGCGGVCRVSVSR
jgi:rare lipoprotein A